MKSGGCDCPLIYRQDKNSAWSFLQWRKVVTVALSVWQSTLLPPVCFWPCIHTPQSQKTSNQPEPENRAPLHDALWSLCEIQAPASHCEAISPLAADTLGLEKYKFTPKEYKTRQTNPQIQRAD